MSERITLVAANVGGQTLVIELQAGVTIDNVLALINSGRVDTRGNEIMLWAPPPYEGGQMLAKIVGRTQGPAPVWTLQHEHKNCCAEVTEQERDSHMADSLTHRAHRLANDGRTKEARSVLSAALTLLDNSGGRDNDLGIWALACEGEILSQEGDLTNAERVMREALALSVKLFGNESPCTAICHGNVAEVLSKTDRTSEALACLDVCLTLLADAEPEGKFVAEYLHGAEQAFSALKAQLVAAQTSTSTPATK